MESNNSNSATSKHKISTREEWLSARLELLKAEKQLTRQSDEVASKRRELPWVKIDKEYSFKTREGVISFADLFKGRSQLLIYHFMFGPDYKAGCPHCSAIADGFNGIWPHLESHDVMFWAVSHAPFDKLQAFKDRMGWTFPWASSYDSDFNYDFNVSYSKEQQHAGNMEYNYHKGNVDTTDSDKKNEAVPDFGAKIAASAGTDWKSFTREAPGMSAFAFDEGNIYHTYSAYARGLDGLWNIYQWLDRAPLGRNENGLWMEHHDEYENTSQDKDIVQNCCS